MTPRSFKRVGLHYIGFPTAAIEAKRLASLVSSKILRNDPTVTNFG